jgi:Ca2+-binding EF-hand superfamily protein
MAVSTGISSSTLASAYFSKQQDLFSQIDANGDGQISPDELSTFRQNLQGTSGPNTKSLFDKIDTNGDGSISKDEWASHRAKRNKAQSALLQIQEDSGNTQATKHHHHGPSGARQANPGQTFSALDTNKDGVISADEWAAAAGNNNGAMTTSDAQIPGTQASSLTGSVTNAVTSATNTVTNGANSVLQTLVSLI